MSNDQLALVLALELEQRDELELCLSFLDSFQAMTSLVRCVKRNYCNAEGKITRRRNNRLTFKRDKRGFLVKMHSVM